ncbi:MAG: hypothetical protein IPK82_07555 [Polyangiaceae bacterium]|nr:hypothetical protein [Polyangiaceae bacterium]
MGEVVTRGDVTWIVRKRARDEIQAIWTTGDATYNDNKIALQEMLCAYFSEGGCISKQTNISPIKGAAESKSKALKVRWGYPGSGKSGGLRLAVVVYCEEKRVEVVACWMRKEDPTDDDIIAALDG